MSQQVCKPLRAGLLAVLLALAWVFAAESDRPLGAQEVPGIRNGAIGVNFPTELIFSAIVDGPQEVEQASLLYQIPPEGSLTRIPAEVTAGEIVRVEAAVTTNAGDRYIPVGADIIWRWQIMLADGTTIENASEHYRYEDPRYDWLVIEGDGLSVYYYGGENAAREVLEAGEAGLATMSRVLGSALPFHVKLYLWESLDDASGVERVRSQRFEMVVDSLGTRVLADLVHVFAPTSWIAVHELTHVLTHFAGEGGIGGLPAWLDEGTATYSEGDWERRRGFALHNAIDRDDLLSLRSMTSAPGDPSRVELFYGQSADIVTFLIEEFGEDRFAELYAVFKAGSTADRALMEVYEVDRDGLENMYRAARGLEPRVRGEDQSIVIEDEPAAVRPIEGTVPEEPIGVVPDVTASEPADVELVRPQRSQEAIEARVAVIEERQGQRRLPASFTGDGGFPTDAVVTGVAAGGLVLGLLMLLLVLGRTGPSPAVTEPSVAPASPQPLAPAASGHATASLTPDGDTTRTASANEDADGVETLTFHAPKDDP